MPSPVAFHLLVVLGLLVSCGSRSTGALDPVPTMTGMMEHEDYPRNVSSPGAGNPSLSADGRFVAYTGRGVLVYDRRTHHTEMNSVSTKGNEIEGMGPVDISADGRYVSFLSSNERVFVRDRAKRTTNLVSLSSSGKAANRGPLTPWQSMSDDGRYVAFNSGADNLVSADTNGVEDIFVRDTVAGKTTRVSVSSSGEEADGASGHPTMSNNGRFVVFIAQASNLDSEAIPQCRIEGSDQLCSELYVHDRVTGVTSLVSVSTGGKPLTARIQDPSISDDGRYVAYSSDAAGAGPSRLDADGTYDIFLHERETGETIELPTSQSGGNWRPQISGAGTLVAYEGGGFDLWLHDVAAGTDRSLGSFYGGSVDFSIDDRLVAFTNGTGQILILDLVDGTSETVPSAPSAPA